MKEYLNQFRDQAFSGAMSLYKRIFLPYLGLNILVSVISALLLVPLVLQFLGWSFADLASLEERMKEVNQTLIDGGDPSTVFSEFSSSFNYIYLIPVFIVGLFILPWSYNLYLCLNDAEIREGNNSILYALKRSFSGKIFTLLGFFILIYLLTIASVVIFIAAIAIIMQMTKVLGIILGFAGFFFLLFFLMRFSLGAAAIVHGNMSISSAFSFSYSKITMKRAALLLLMMIVIVTVMAIVGGLSGVIIALFMQKDNADPMQYFVLNQIISSIIGAICGAFIMAGLSAVYFRYSSDEAGTSESDHLVEN